MEKQTIEKLARLKQEDLEFYQKMIGFFSLLGIDEGDLADFVEMARNWKSAVEIVNRVAGDQAIINRQLNEIKVDVANIKGGNNPNNAFVEEMRYGR